jgi:hypothetical protein
MWSGSPATRSAAFTTREAGINLMPRSNRAAAGVRSRASVRAKNRKLKADAPPEKRRGKEK